MRSADLRSFVHFSPNDVRRDTVFETDRVWAQMLCFERNQSTEPMVDPTSDALVQVLAGEGVVFVAGKRKRVKQWDAVLVPAGSEFQATNASQDPLVLFMVAAPPPRVTGPDAAPAAVAERGGDQR